MTRSAADISLPNLIDPMKGTGNQLPKSRWTAGPDGFDGALRHQDMLGLRPKISLRQLAKEGKALGSTRAISLCIPAGFIIAVNPLKGRGHMSRAGASWSRVTFRGQLRGLSREHSRGHEAERVEYEALIKAAPVLERTDLTSVGRRLWRD